jgi:hypothetical protein
MNKSERTILQCLGGAIIVFVIHLFLSNYFSDIDFEGNWEGDNSSVSFFPQKFQSSFYMSRGHLPNDDGFIAIAAPHSFVDYFDDWHDWPRSLAETCDENKKIIMTFASNSLTKADITQLPIYEKHETFTTKREIKSSSWKFSKNYNWWSGHRFRIEGVYDSFELGGDSTVYFCKTTKLLQEKILFGLLNYDQLTIRVENADSFVVDGSYRIASYPTNKIKESDLQLFKENI